ncbi:MAG TPA: glycosyltransferase family 4 protein [Stellaceae bacterium]|nr:glycosyltransferase family 4 protein [Stellaceae bacterium]
MRIISVIHGLWGGGAERALCTLAGGWAEAGHEVTILTFEHVGGPSYALHPAVQVRCLGLAKVSRHLPEALSQNYRRLRVLRRAIRESDPAIVVSFMERTNVLTLLATRGLGRAVVVSEQTDPLLYDIGRLWAWVRRVCYPFADVLVCPTARTLARFQAMTRVRGVVIPNPIVIPSRAGQTSEKNSERRTLIAMGRLVHQKGFDLLLEAFARIALRHPDWSLTIIGKGPLQRKLQEQSAALDLGARVHFVGELTDPFPMLRAADLFVLSSRFEGFGMALAEAMACGLPVVSFDCPEGPRDIIHDGVDGILVPTEDINALATALGRLMNDPRERARLGTEAATLLTRFGPEPVLSIWQDMFDGLIAARLARKGAAETTIKSSAAKPDKPLGQRQ